MNVEVFVLCDAATESGGKLNILGAFDSIFAKEFPAVHPFCAIALRIRFAKIEEGSHHVRITFIDADGKAILPNLDADAHIKVGPDQQSACANLILNIGGLKFPQAGQYSIDLAIDGRYEKSVPVFIRPIPQQGSSQQP